jgi:NAD(P)-dependent dehydrogenase (short-subunit alcohol dehydrogenase family)
VSRDAVIGVLGGSGAVGRTTVSRLATLGLGPLRVGGRDPDRTRQVCDNLTGIDATPFPVDLADPEQLDAFCRGCQVVVNCAGPSYRILDTVARTTLDVGAHYVDAAGDLPALDALRTNRPTPPTTQAVVFSAGVMPGLTGLLPRALARDATPTRLDIYVGGAAAITPASAVDVLLTRGPAFGVPLAAWRDRRVTLQALSPLRNVALPGFDTTVHAWPFLTTEAVDLAQTLDLDELRSYSVYPSDNLPHALAEAWADNTGPVERYSGSIVNAAATDVDVYGPSYTLMFQTRARPTTGGAARRLTLRTTDPNALSGVVTAHTVDAVLGGSIAAGIHLAASVLDPEHMLHALTNDPLVTSLELQ